jgi:hypothetical protein
VGNSFEDLSDFEAAPFSRAGSFNTVGLHIGDTLRFDVTRIYNESIGLGIVHLDFDWSLTQRLVTVLGLSIHFA